MTTTYDYYRNRDGHIICRGHLEPLLDEGSEPITDEHYDAVSQSTSIVCSRCESRNDDPTRNPVAADFLRTNGASWGDRNSTSGEPASEVEHCFTRALEGLEERSLVH